MKLIFKIFCMLFSLFFVLVIFGCRFAPLSLEEAKSNLENAGYEVRIVPGDEFVDSDENPFPVILASELENYIVAKKDEDIIHMYFFINTTKASDNYAFMQYNKLYGGQNNQLVYFGTKQANKDAGL